MPTGRGNRRDETVRRFVNQLDDMGWIVWNTELPGAAYAEVECPSGHPQVVKRDSFQGRCMTCHPDKGSWTLIVFEAI